MLITKSDFSTYDRQISQTDFGNVDQFIRDAHFSDLKELMGMDFYFDVLRNPTTTKNSALINGGTYTYSGNTYTNVGIKAVLVHYAYARYVLQGSNTDTPFGFVQKNTPESTEVSYQEKKSIYTMNRQIAYDYWDNVRIFIERNVSDYPLYKYMKMRKFKFSKISGKDI